MRALIVGIGPVEEALAGALRRHRHDVVCMEVGTPGMDPVGRPCQQRCVVQARVVQAPDGTLAEDHRHFRFTDKAIPLLERWRDDPFPWLVGGANVRIPEGDPIVD